jgi:hypothetical protein
MREDILDFLVQGQPGLQSELRTCRDTKRNPVWKTSKKKKKERKKEQKNKRKKGRKEGRKEERKKDGKKERKKERKKRKGFTTYFFKFCVCVFFSIFKIFIRFYFGGLRVLVLPGSGGTCLNSQHLGGRGTWIFYFEATLVYRVSSRTVRDTQKIPVSKN